MKFSTRQDTDLSSDELFHLISDFEQIERLIARRGARIARINPAREPGAGMAWEISFDWRGRKRDLRLDVIRFDRPEIVTLEGRSEQFDILIDMRVIALTRSKARLQFELDLRPRNMKARLLLQTAKLGKAQLDRRFALGIAQTLEDLTRALASPRFAGFSLSACSGQGISMGSGAG